MTAPLISSEISRFLSNKEPEVLCIKGKWGVGKTYAWKFYLAEAQRQGRVALDRYSYVSLFGQNSLSDVRNSIVENGVDSRKTDAQPDLASLETGTKLLRKGANAGSFLASFFPQTSKYAESVQRIMYLLLGPQIICIDDLERAGAGLSTKDILGLASQLKEEKRCKIVILLNDEMLSENGKADFESQLEKVADTVLYFDPTPIETADIGISKTTAFADKLRNNCIKLGIVNIRVLKKAERFCQRLSDIIIGLDDRVLDEAIHTATLACYAKFQPGIAPPLSYIKSFNSWEKPINDINKRSDETSPSYDILSNYGVNEINEFDLQIIDGIEKGFFDEHEIRSKASILHKNFAESDQRGAYYKAWALFHGSLDANENEIVDALDKEFRSSVNLLDPGNLDSVVDMMRKLGASDKASALIKFFVETRQDNAEYWDLENHSFRGVFKDEELKSAFRAKQISTHIEARPAEIIIKIAEREGWSEKDIAIIANLTPDKLADMLRSAEGEELKSTISGMRQLLRISNPSPDLQKVQHELNSAFELISKDSSLNAMRIQGWFRG